MSFSIEESGIMFAPRMIKLILSNVLVRKLIKFGIVGGTSFLVSYLFFLACCQYHFRYVDAKEVDRWAYLLYATLGDVVGLLVGFRLNKRWTFRHQANSGKKYFLSYTLVYLVTFLVNKSVMVLVVDYMLFIDDSIRLYTAPIIATGVSASLNFLGTNHIVFRVGADDEITGSGSTDVIDSDI